MKRVIFIALFFTTVGLFAQDRRGPSPEEMERIKAAKVACVTERLELDSKTAQKFWPIFNEYEEAKEKLGKEFFEKMVDDFGIHSLSREAEKLNDEQSEKLLALLLDKQEQQLSLEKDYMAKFAKVLSPKQVLLVHRFDSDFRRKLMNRFWDDKGRDNRGNPRGGGQ